MPSSQFAQSAKYLNFFEIKTSKNKKETNGQGKKNILSSLCSPLENEGKKNLHFWHKAVISIVIADCISEAVILSI